MHLASFSPVARRLALILLSAGCFSAPAQAATPWHRVLLGHSVEGRPIVALEAGDPSSKRKVLVVGCIHGNEPAGIAITSRLATLRPPPGVDLWLLPVLNPDGVAAGTRGNAHGVDLNRNQPWQWKPLTGVYYSGPKPLSEPESRIARRLILKLRPRVTIWFHQHMNLVAEATLADVALQRRFARLVGLDLVRLGRYHGSFVAWANATLPGTTAFAVELPAGALSAASTRTYASAVLAVARSLR